MLEAMSMYPCWLFVSQKTDQNISAISYMSFFGSGKGFLVLLCIFVLFSCVQKQYIADTLGSDTWKLRFHMIRKAKLVRASKFDKNYIFLD